MYVIVVVPAVVGTNLHKALTGITAISAADCTVIALRVRAKVTVLELDKVDTVAQVLPPLVEYCKLTVPVEALPIDAVQDILTLYINVACSVLDGVNVELLISLVTELIDGI